DQLVGARPSEQLVVACTAVDRSAAGRCGDRVRASSAEDALEAAELLAEIERDAACLPAVRVDEARRHPERVETLAPVEAVARERDDRAHEGHDVDLQLV